MAGFPFVTNTTSIYRKFPYIITLGHTGGHRLHNQQGSPLSTTVKHAMPVTYAIDQHNHLVRITGTGVLTDGEMIQCVSDLRSDPALKPDMKTLSDMRKIEVAFTAQGIEKMLGVMCETSEHRKEAKAAIVVSSDVAFGMGRMLEMTADGTADPSFMIFRDMASACEWLGIEEEN